MNTDFFYIADVYDTAYIHPPHNSSSDGWFFTDSDIIKHTNMTARNSEREK